jgi:acyl carrier protein
LITTTLLESEAQIRNVLRNYGRLNQDAGEVDSAADLYQCGLTSHASVNVMLGLEAAFHVEFPDHMLKRNVFSSIDSISRAIGDLTAA